MSVTITVGEAINLINDSILNFEDGLPQDTIDRIAYSINNEIQVRDYFLGLPDTFTLATCKSFLTYLMVSLDEADRYSVETILSAYYYETDEVNVSQFLLGKALNTKPNYSLANLLKRIVEAGWSPNNFATMRKELHPQVIEKLAEMQDQLIEVEA